MCGSHTDRIDSGPEGPLAAGAGGAVSLCADDLCESDSSQQGGWIGRSVQSQPRKRRTVVAAARSKSGQNSQLDPGTTVCVVTAFSRGKQRERAATVSNFSTFGWVHGTANSSIISTCSSTPFPRNDVLHQLDLLPVAARSIATSAPTLAAYLLIQLAAQHSFRPDQSGFTL